MKPFLVLLLKELKSIKKEKTILFAILIQFFIASFSSIILIGIMSFYDPTSIGDNTHVTIDVGVVGNNSKTMVGFLEERNLTVKPYDNINNAEEAFQQGEIDTIMSIPPDIDGTVDMTLVSPKADTSKTLILMILNEPLRKYENYFREINGIDLNYDDMEGKPHTTREFLYAVIIPILMLFPGFIAGSIVIDTISEEIESKTLDTLWSAPISLNQILGSKVTAALIMAIFQCILWIILLRFNHFTVHNAVSVLMLSFMIAACISLSAAMVALYFKDRERAQFVFSIILLFVAGCSYLLNPSPFDIITRLASGDHFISTCSIFIYVIPLTILTCIFIIMSKRLIRFKT